MKMLIVFLFSNSLSAATCYQKEEARKIYDGEIERLIAGLPGGGVWDGIHASSEISEDQDGFTLAYTYWSDNGYDSMEYHHMFEIKKLDCSMRDIF